MAQLDRRPDCTASDATKGATGQKCLGRTPRCLGERVHCWAQVAPALRKRGHLDPYVCQSTTSQPTLNSSIHTCDTYSYILWTYAHNPTAHPSTSMILHIHLSTQQAYSPAHLQPYSFSLHACNQPTHRPALLTTHSLAIHTYNAAPQS